MENELPFQILLSCLSRVPAADAQDVAVAQRQNQLEVAKEHDSISSVRNLDRGNYKESSWRSPLTAMIEEHCKTFKALSSIRYWGDLSLIFVMELTLN